MKKYRYRIGLDDPETLSLVFDHDSNSDLETTVLEEACKALKLVFNGDHEFLSVNQTGLSQMNLYAQNLEPGKLYIKNCEEIVIKPDVFEVANRHVN
jgi:hypothetical protein